MNPERFDELTRLWAAAPSRRAFVLEVGAFLAFSMVARVGIRLPRWLGPAQDKAQCFAHRDGMPCGGPAASDVCGICQSGKCIPVDSRCQGVDPCSRCDPEGIKCTKCPKGKDCCPSGQKCCKDGCCDGKCTEDGACCPKDKQCGKDNELCCRECEECGADRTCHLIAMKECPDTHFLINDCCVCKGRLCNGVCCGDQPCVGGKCCEPCGLDGAVCCDGRKCCRERCVDPTMADKCCECWEDMPADEAKSILDGKEGAKYWADYVKKNDVKYGQDKKADPRDPNPTILDCSLFVQKSASGKLFMKEYTDRGQRISTLVLDGDCQLRRLKSGEAPRAGDLVAQPRASGPPGSLHVGIATGVGHRVIAMGGDKDKGSAQELTWGPDGTTEGGDKMRVYRPQKPKKDCPKK
jgi:hypothetical protein